MAGITFTTKSVPVSDNALNGGLNSTSGPLNLGNNESSELQNVDFDKFGSVLKRNGYAVICTAGLFAGASTEKCDGLYWAEFTTGGTITRVPVTSFGSILYKMDDVDGTWDNITGGATVTSGNAIDFEMYNTTLFMTNGVDAPFKWVTGDTATTSGIPTGLTKAKYVRQFNNYLFYANVVVGGVNYPTRIYFSGLRTPETFDSADWIEIAKDDGQEITGLKVLGDRLVVYKEKSIYNVYYTGDSDIPFILPGGGKSNSSVGCIAPFSIQEVENGHVFLSYDGIYWYDGMNSYKLSDRITATLEEFSKSRLRYACSLVYKKKSQYWLSFSYSGQVEHNRIIVWDYFNNAFSIYTGMYPSAMTTFFVNGVDERPHFGDYDGFVYRADYTANDAIMNTATAVNAYYYTNWKHYDDLCDQKGIPHVYIYYQSSNSTLTFAYSFDFEDTDQYTQTFSISAGASVYGTAVYGTDTYSGAGGAVTRRDLIGRGRVARFKFANNTLGESFRIDGFGSMPHLESMA